MSNPTSITIDNIKYVREDSVNVLKPSGKICIVILPRGWNVVGYFSQSGPYCRLTNAAVIRRWGTTKGLGEIAFNGPLQNTILDKTPEIEFHELTMIGKIHCVEEKWLTHLK